MFGGFVQVITGFAWLTVSVTVVVTELRLELLGLKVADKVCDPAFSTVPAAGE